VRNGKTLNVKELLHADRQMMRLEHDEARDRLWLSNWRELCYYEEGKLKKLRNHNRGLQETSLISILTGRIVLFL
jgi:hypothetical protein